jgi:hypothetical protein
VSELERAPENKELGSEQILIGDRLKVSVILFWFLFLLGLATVVYPVFVQRPLFPSISLGDLRSIPLWLLPFEYTFSYMTRAWGPLLFAFCMGGIIAGFVPREKFHRLMSSGKTSSYFIAASAAPFLTVCSCAMIPIFGGLLFGGAGLGPAIAFLLMAPAANIMAIMITGSMISWKIAIARVVICYFGSVIVGMIVVRTPQGKKLDQHFTERSRLMNFDEVDHVPSFLEKSYLSLEESLGFAAKILPFLLGGVFVISFVEAYMPPQIVSHYMTGIKGVFLGAVIGVPSYTPSLVEVFLVKAMLNLGMSPSSALAFLIGGPICSIPSMLAVSRVINWKVTLTYASLTILMAIAGGLIYMNLIGTL